MFLSKATNKGCAKVWIYVLPILSSQNMYYVIYILQLFAGRLRRSQAVLSASPAAEPRFNTSEGKLGQTRPSRKETSSKSLGFHNKDYTVLGLGI